MIIISLLSPFIIIMHACVESDQNVAGNHSAHWIPLTTSDCHVVYMIKLHNFHQRWMALNLGCKHVSHTKPKFMWVTGCKHRCVVCGKLDLSYLVCEKYVTLCNLFFSLNQWGFVSSQVYSIWHFNYTTVEMAQFSFLSTDIPHRIGFAFYCIVMFPEKDTEVWCGVSVRVNVRPASCRV